METSENIATLAGKILQGAYNYSHNDVRRLAGSALAQHEHHETEQRVHDYATLEEMQAWARRVMYSRKPDFVIGDDYLRRWWVVPRNRFQNVYLHHMLQSDDDRALHDHPSDNTSILLEGSYIEHMPDPSLSPIYYDGEGVTHISPFIVSVTRQAGDIVHRNATDAHRLELPPGGEAISLFLMGPPVREWGFWCESGWRPWREFVDTRDKGAVGRGCGE